MTSWIETFTQYTDRRPSPLIFKKWAAVAAVAAALERRVSVRLWGRNLFPNMYTVLVGPPGVGKSMAITEVEQLCQGAKEIKLAPSNLSKASLIDAIAHATKKVVFPVFEEYNSLFVIASELGVFLTDYGELVTLLQKMWDNERFEEWKRTGDRKILIERPQLNLLGGITPSDLSTRLPEGAWDQGFSSRTIFVFSDERTDTDPLALEDFSGDVSTQKDLVYDLENITTLNGTFRWDPAAGKAFTAWHMHGNQPQPDHPRLVNYLPRRTIHLAKLCMVLSGSRGNDLVITMEDYETALGWLIEAELFMPEIFKAMTVKGGDVDVINEAFHYIFKLFAKENKPISAHRLIYFVTQRVPPYSVLRVIENMVRSGMLKLIYIEGKEFYSPGIKPI